MAFRAKLPSYAQALDNIKRLYPDRDCEETWAHFIKSHLRLVDTVGNRRVTLYSRNNKIKTYNYGSVTHKAQPWPEALTAIAQHFNIPLEHDHCLYQVFKKQASINFHADDEPLILKDSAITTLNIGHAELRTKRIADGSPTRNTICSAGRFATPIS